MCTSLTAQPPVSRRIAEPTRIQMLLDQYRQESSGDVILGAMLEKSPAAQAILEEFNSETMPAISACLRQNRLSCSQVASWGRLLVLISLLKRPGSGAPRGNYTFADYVKWAKEF